MGGVAGSWVGLGAVAFVSLVVLGAPSTARAVAGNSAQVADDQRLDDLFARLSSGSADERRRVEIELADAIQPGDARQISAFVAQASAEGSARVASALAQHDRHLAIVAELLGIAGRSAEVADSALDGLVARFEPGLFDAPLVDVQLWRRLEQLSRSAANPIGRLDLARPPAEVALDLARWEGLPLRILVDPILEQSPAPVAGTARVVEGEWRDVLREAVLQLDLGIEALLVEPEGARDQAPILALRVTRRGLEGRQRGRDLIGRWLLQFRTAARPGERTAAARALASTGWPAAQSFLLDMWRREGDRDAILGLLRGAELGTAPAALPDQRDAARLIELVRADLESGAVDSGRFSRDALEGLVGLPRLDPAGAPLHASATTPDRHALLVPRPVDAARSPSETAFARFALELTGRTRLATEGLDRRLVEWITAPASVVRAADRRLALSAFVRCYEVAPPAPAAPFALLGLARDRTGFDELLWILVASAAPVPSEFEDPSSWSVLDRERDSWARAVGVGWSLALGEIASAAAGVRSAYPLDRADAWGRTELALVLELARRRGEGAGVRAVLEAAATSAESAQYGDELALLCGLVDPRTDASTAEASYQEALARRDARGHGDPLLLATLVVGPTADRARAVLLGEFVGAAESAPDDHTRRNRVLAGLERAVAVMFAAREDGAAAGFVAGLKRLARERARDVLSQSVLALDWPRGEGPTPVLLARPGPIR